MKKTRIGLVGKGISKRLYYPILHEFKSVDIEFLDYPHIYKENISDLQFDLFLKASKRFDIILIGSPPFAHYHHIMLALQQSNYIICEKPVGLTSDCPRFYMESYGDNNFIGVNYELRFSKILEKLRNIISSNEIEVIEIEYYSSVRINKHKLPEWYLNVNQGGGIKYSILPHIIDMIYFLGFNFSSFQADKANLTLDKLHLLGTLNESIRLSIDINTVNENSFFNIKIKGKGFYYFVDFIAGEIYLKEVFNKQLHKPEELSSRSGILWQEAFKEMMKVVISNFRKDYNYSDSIPNLADAVKVHQVISLIYDV